MGRKQSLLFIGCLLCSHTTGSELHKAETLCSPGWGHLTVNSASLASTEVSVTPAPLAVLKMLPVVVSL